MKKTTMLMAVFTVVCSGALAEAQVYVQPANYYTPTQPTNYGTYNGNYTVSQPLYGAPATYGAPAAYTPVSNYTPVTTYYAGSACGQPVTCNYNPCCNPCACNPCATTTYVSASPCAPQAVYSPVAYAPAPVACGPQIRRGLLGQPVVYVPGQPLRNALRFLAP